MFVKRVFNRLAASLAGLAGLGLATTASAENLSTLALVNAPTLENGNFYVSLQGGPVWTDLPDYTVGDTVTTPGGVTSRAFDDSDTLGSGQGGLTLGYVLPDSFSPLPGWARRQRIEAWFGGASGDGTTTAGRSVAPLSALRAISIDGQLPAVGITAITFIQGATLKTDQMALGGGLRFRFDVQASDRLLLRPVIGVTFGHSGREYDYRSGYSPAAIPGTSTFKHDILEDLDSFEVGGELGLDARYRLTDHFHLIGGFRIMPTAVNTDYSGRDCFIFGATGSASCFDGSANFTSSATDEEGILAVRVGLSAGFVLHGDWWALTVMGFGNWNSASPTIVHPTLGPGVAFPAAPARIDHESVWSYGAVFRMDISLY